MLMKPVLYGLVELCIFPFMKKNKSIHRILLVVFRWLSRRAQGRQDAWLSYMRVTTSSRLHSAHCPVKWFACLLSSCTSRYGWMHFTCICLSVCPCLSPLSISLSVCLFFFFSVSVILRGRVGKVIARYNCRKKKCNYLTVRWRVLGL